MRLLAALVVVRSPIEMAPPRAYPPGMDTFDDGLDADPEPLDPAVSEALEAAQAWLGGSVQAVGLGETEHGEPCVLVYAGPGARVPQFAGELPVRVVTSEELRAEDGQVAPEA